jgi:hypothetical protein
MKMELCFSKNGRIKEREKSVEVRSATRKNLRYSAQRINLIRLRQATIPKAIATTAKESSLE